MLSSLSASRPRDRDAEELQAKLLQVKDQLNLTDKENGFLKAQMQRLLQQLRRKDDQHRQILAIKCDQASDAGADAIVIGQIRELRGEMTAIARLTEKFRDLERVVHERDEELRRLRAKQTFTQMQEVQIEAQTYYNELRRTRKQVVSLQNQVRTLQQQRASDAAMWQQHQQTMPTSPMGVAYDQQLFLKLRQEVEYLRNENIRLAANAHEAGRDQRGVHVLNDGTNGGGNGSSHYRTDSSGQDESSVYQESTYDPDNLNHYQNSSDVEASPR